MTQIIWISPLLGTRGVAWNDQYGREAAVAGASVLRLESTHCGHSNSPMTQVMNCPIASTPSAFNLLSVHVTGTHGADVTMPVAVPDDEDNEGVAAMPGFAARPKPPLNP